MPLLKASAFDMMTAFLYSGLLLNWLAALSVVVVLHASVVLLEAMAFDNRSLHIGQNNNDISTDSPLA